MLFHVRMAGSISYELAPAIREDLITTETRAVQLQRVGTWVQLWRILGLYDEISVSDVDSSEQSHRTLTSTPIVPYLRAQVTTPTGTRTIWRHRAMGTELAEFSRKWRRLSTRARHGPTSTAPPRG